MLTFANLLPPYVVLFGLAAIGATLFGVAALWAVGGRAGWLARTAPVVLLLAALVPIGAYELLAVFGGQVAFVIAWVLVVRLGRAFRDSRNLRESRRDALRSAWRQQLRDRTWFRLRDVLLVVLLAGAVSAIVRLAEPAHAPLGSLSNVAVWGVAVAVGALLGLVTVAAEWTIFGRARWYFRVPFLLVAVTALCPVLYWGLGLNPFAAVVCGVALVLSVGLMRSAGWAPWRRLPEDQQPAPDEATQSSKRVRRLSQAALSAAAVASLAIFIPAYWAILPSKPTVAVELPDPNGYDELVRLGRFVNWSAISTQDVDAASVTACRTFVQDNTEWLARVHEAIAMPSRNPVLSRPTNPAVTTGFGFLRSIARALTAQAKLAEAEGRHADAVAAYLDLVQLGDSVSRGGLLVHRLLGIALESMGLHGIEALVPQLDAAQLTELRQPLEKLVEEREASEQLFEREKDYGSATYGWVFRLLVALDHPLVAPAYQTATIFRKRSDAHRRLILTEAALRRYVLERGTLPNSLAALVPEYLSEVPQDPYGDGPLLYRTADGGYLLYSIGSNGTDDGGQRVSFNDATRNFIGDLFFGVPEETPKETDAQEETVAE